MPVVGVPLLECICWDHDRFGKDYLGEFDIALEDLFEEGQVNQQVGRPGNEGEGVRWLNYFPASMVHTQIKATITTLEPEEEEGQQRVG